MSVIKIVTLDNSKLYSKTEIGKNDGDLIEIEAKDAPIDIADPFKWPKNTYKVELKYEKRPY